MRYSPISLQTKERNREAYAMKVRQTYCIRKACSWKRQGINKATYKLYKQLLHSQGGVCAICGRTPKEEGKMLSLDHDHTTGDVRGVLCFRCNSSLATFDKNGLLIKAFHYLKKYKDKVQKAEEGPEEESALDGVNI